MSTMPVASPPADQVRPLRLRLERSERRFNAMVTIVQIGLMIVSLFVPYYSWSTVCSSDSGVKLCRRYVVNHHIRTISDQFAYVPPACRGDV
jgi:hypothetical protein